MTAGSSGWLADAYVQRARDGRAIDALINYEAVLLSLDASGQLPKQLTLIYPSDGVIASEYPLTLLTGASDQARTNFRAVPKFLLRPDMQGKIMTKTHRRPVNTDIKLNFAVPVLPSRPLFGENNQAEMQALAALTKGEFSTPEPARYRMSSQISAGTNEYCQLSKFDPVKQEVGLGRQWPPMPWH